MRRGSWFQGSYGIRGFSASLAVRHTYNYKSDEEQHGMESSETVSLPLRYSHLASYVSVSSHTKATESWYF